MLVRGCVDVESTRKTTVVVVTMERVCQRLVETSFFLFFMGFCSSNTIELLVQQLAALRGGGFAVVKG